MCARPPAARVWLAEVVYQMEHARPILVCLLVFGWCVIRTGAATLSGGFTPIPQGAVVDLTTEGPLDWIHWGRFTASSVDRKAGVTPWIPGFTPIGRNGPFQYADNFNGYSWSDGVPAPAATNTPTGVWMWGKSNGFQLSVPAATATRTLKVYVGTFGAVGRFTARLGTLIYTDASISNPGNGPGGVYTLTYAADSDDLTLSIQYVVDRTMDSAGNVTLQAAALTAPGVPFPPQVSLASPSDAANFQAGGAIDLVASATDRDGTIARVEFFQGDTKLGEATAGPYAFTWTGVTAGRYRLTARATDNAGSVATSVPVSIFVSSGGGSLSAGSAPPPPSVDLSAEGNLDWAHWGFSDPAGYDHKAGVLPQIRDLAEIGDDDRRQLLDNLTAFSWTGGTPTTSAADTTTGVFVGGQDEGFRLAVAADSRVRTLRVYAGLYGAQGNFFAYLSDFSAPAYTDTSLSSVFGNGYAVYTLQYEAASPGAELIVEYTAGLLYDVPFGNITLEAATLSGPAGPANAPPSVSLTSPADNQTFPAPAVIPLDALASDSDGTIARVEFFAGASSLGVATAPPYSLVWSNVAAGTYSLTAAATDDQGATAYSAPVQVSVIGVAAAPMTLAALRLGGDSFSFEFATEAGRTYTVERALTLAPPDWQTWTNRVGDGGPFTVLDSTTAAVQKFYRVRIE